MTLGQRPPAFWFPIAISFPLFPNLAHAADFEHVLLVVADDLGTDKVGAYANDVANAGETRPDTPNLDAIAAAGVRFTDAWAAPVCSPTRAMLLTGEYNHRNGIGTTIREGSSTRLQATPTTLAKLASEAGLKTALFGKWHLGETTSSPDTDTTVPLAIREVPVQSGFSHFAGNMDGDIESYTRWLQTVSSADPTTGRYTTTATTLTVPATDRTTDDAEAWLASQAGSRRRTFAMVSYHLPHATRGADGAWTWSDAASSCGVAPSGDDRADHRAAVECLDAELAELFGGTPDLERTLVIVVGDNGTDGAVAEGRFDDGRGKGTVYESGVRVPLLVADGAAVRDALGGRPLGSGVYRVTPGLEVSDPSSVVDVYATVADLLGLSSSSCVLGSTCARDSVSLRPLLTGGAPSRDEVWTETFYRAASGRWVGAAALRFGDHKLVVRTGSGATPCHTSELYDLGVDRWEEQDLWGDPAHADEQAVLEDLLTDRLAVMATTSSNWLSATTCP